MARWYLIVLALVLVGCETDFPPIYRDVTCAKNASANEISGTAIPNKGFANTDTIIGLDNYTGNYQNTHPKVLYFSQQLFGHKYWMAYTPYPYGKPEYENPSIAYSDNGKVWHNIRCNPIDKPKSKEGKYNSDAHLVYNNRTGKLETWFRYADEANESETIYRMTSTNGQIWNNKEELHTLYGAHCSRCLSPTIIYNGDKYQIWVVNAQKKVIEYYESLLGTDWEYVRSIDLSYETDTMTGYTPWHLDVIHADGRYQMVVMAKHPQKDVLWTLFYTESTDNKDWTPPTELLSPRKGHWDENLYRSSLVKIDGGYALYYAGRRANKFHIGATWAKSPI